MEVNGIAMGEMEERRVIGYGEDEVQWETVKEQEDGIKRVTAEIATSKQHPTHPTLSQEKMTAFKMTHILPLAIFATCYVAIAQAEKLDHPLDLYLKEHVRALDAGHDVFGITVPVSARQAVGGAPACEDISRCIPPTTNCGAFKCSFCSKLRCLPSRKVTRGRTVSEITCSRSPCKKQPNPSPATMPDRYCCTRNFCITNTCKPAVLPPVSLAGRSVGDTVTVNTAIKIPKRLKTDIYMLSDTTGSMGGEISAVSKQMLGLIKNLKTSTSQDLAFGLGEFRDENDFPGGGFRNVAPVSLLVNKTREAAANLKAARGGDGPEAGLVALYKVATDPGIMWRKLARKIVVFYGDAPQHEPTCVNEKSISRADVIDKLKAKGIAVVSVSFQRGLDRATHAYGCDKKANRSLRSPGNQAREISKKTGGAHAEVTASMPRDKDVMKKILDAIGKSDLVLDLAGSTCEAAVSVEYIPPFPRVVEPGTTVTFKQKITIDRGVCDFFPDECKNTFSVSGPLVAEQTIATISVAGCGPSF